MQDQEIQEKLKRHRDHIRTEVASLNPIATTSQGRIMAGIELLLSTLEDTDVLFRNKYPSIFQDVEDFHKKFGIEYSGPPRKMPRELAEYRFKFMQEELNEWWQAYLSGDLQKQLDGLLDLMYVASGTLQFSGFTPNISYEAWRRIQLANLAKVRSSDTNPSVREYDECNIAIVKPMGWIAPDFSDLLPTPVESEA